MRTSKVILALIGLFMMGILLFELLIIQQMKQTNYMLIRMIEQEENNDSFYDSDIDNSSYQII